MDKKHIKQSEEKSTDAHTNEQQRRWKTQRQKQKQKQNIKPNNWSMRRHKRFVWYTNECVL